MNRIVNYLWLVTGISIIFLVLIKSAIAQLGKELEKTEQLVLLPQFSLLNAPVKSTLWL